MAEPGRGRRGRSNEEDVFRRFGDRVRRLRTERDWTIQDLARRAGMNRTYVGQVERGLRNVTLLTLLSLADAFEIDVTALVAGLRN